MHRVIHCTFLFTIAPLPPREVICTRKLNGYKISWQHDHTPGRPQVYYFIIEYRQVNSSARWRSLKLRVQRKRRHISIEHDVLHPKKPLEFRMFAFSNTFILSEPSNVAIASEEETGKLVYSFVSDADFLCWFLWFSQSILLTGPGNHWDHIGWIHLLIINIVTDKEVNTPLRVLYCYNKI